MNQAELIEAVTREVLAALSSGDPCEDCHGSCAAHSPDKVRSVVANGADRVSYRGGGAEVPMDLAKYIDHTLLKPDTTAEDIDVLCAEAKEYGFASVCVNPAWVKRAAKNLRGTEVRVASVVGFPFGATLPEIKAMEARRVLRDGAREIDMVINIGALKSGQHDVVQTDIAKVSDACHESGALNKVIIETSLLTDEEKVMASHLAKLGQGRLRQDVDRLRRRRRHRRRRPADARDGGSQDGHQGIGRRSEPRRCRGDDRRRSNQDRCVGGHRNRHRRRVE